MCIIVIKKAGIKIPDTLKTCWDNNPEGAGFMYADGKKVNIQKGFMKYKQFNKAIKRLEIDITAVPMVFHFRITTHGGTSQGNTHPFPISKDIKDLKKLQNRVDVGVCHNGIISGYGKKTISDTMDYIQRQLAPMQKLQKNFYNNPLIIDIIDKAICSKMVFLDYKGNVKTIGNFITDGGVQYSNDSYSRARYTWIYNDEYYNNFNYLNPRYTSLNWLTSGYVLLPNGNLVEPWDYLIDWDNKVYQYLYDMDACKLIDDARAYTDAGNNVKFKWDEIECMEIL